MAWIRNATVSAGPISSPARCPSPSRTARPPVPPRRQEPDSDQVTPSPKGQPPLGVPVHVARGLPDSPDGTRPQVTVEPPHGLRSRVVVNPKVPGNHAAREARRPHVRRLRGAALIHRDWRGSRKLEVDRELDEGVKPLRTGRRRVDVAASSRDGNARMGPSDVMLAAEHRSRAVAGIVRSQVRWSTPSPRRWACERSRSVWTFTCQVGVRTSQHVTAGHLGSRRAADAWA